MDFYSFDDGVNKIRRDPEQSNLYNLLQLTVVYNPDVKLKIFPVPREMEMRLDKVSEHLYGSNAYTEELMAINDIINPYSIIEGQEIFFCEISQFRNMYLDDKLFTDDSKRLSMIKSTQPIDRGASGNATLSPTIMPKNLEQLKIDKKNKSVKVINSFE